MVIIIPKWRAHNVNDWDSLWVTATDGSAQLNQATSALINYLPAVGITELTSENADDAWRRIAIHQALFGSFISCGDKCLFLTRADVWRHVGIETEGEARSFAQFCASIELRAPEADETLLPFGSANGGRSLLSACGVPA